MRGSGEHSLKLPATSHADTCPKANAAQILYHAPQILSIIAGDDNERTDYMQSILEEFAYGNISPETQYFKRDSEFGQAMRAVSKNKKKLFGRLNEEEKVIFQKYVDAQGEVNQLTAVKNLIYGYKLGVLMTAEAFQSNLQWIVHTEKGLPGVAVPFSIVL